MSTRSGTNLLDYRLLRLLVGLVALLMPLIVSIVSQVPLASISTSFHTGARDAFVGMLFMIGTFLIAYNGKSVDQAVMSKIAGVAAIITALFPACADPCALNLTAIIHAVASVSLFLILIYFCFVFYRTARSKPGRKKTRRMKIYLVCGIIMVASVAAMAIVVKVMPCKEMNSLQIIFWGETIALEAFGCAWLVAGQWRGMKMFIDADDSFKLSDSLEPVKEK